MYEFDPDKIEQASDSLQKVELSLTRLSRSIGTELTQALEQAVFSSKSLSDVFRGLALGISKDIFSASLQPLQTAVSTGVSSLINSFVGGGVTPFAKGGVVQGATLFGAGGGLGLMGEAGGGSDHAAVTGCKWTPWRADTGWGCFDCQCDDPDAKP
jgi:phage-related minor tail protein